MQGFWITLAWGLASLLAVSVLVALFEYLRQAGKPAVPIESPLPRALRLDVDLDAVPEAAAPVVAVAATASAPPPAFDAEARRAALSDVLQRLQQNNPDGPWVETTPMVLARQAKAEAG